MKPFISIRAVLVGGLLILMTACGATTPPSASPTAATAKEAVPVATDTAATPVAGSATKVPPGFKLVVRNGVELFCQTRGVTGSRARAAEFCYTQEEYRRMEEIREQYREAGMSAGSQGSVAQDSPN
jgi:hypothetical protein